MAWQLARLPGQVTVAGVAKPLGWALLNIDAESQYEINLHDPKQCARVQDSLLRLSAASPGTDAPLKAQREGKGPGARPLLS
jgi:hypothetical protein